MANNKSNINRDVIINPQTDSNSIPKRKEREPMFYIAVGQKGIGKTYQTIRIIDQYWKFGNPSVGLSPRKVLLFDVNNEYQQYSEIACDKDTIRKFMAHPLIECRRVASKRPDGSTKSDLDFQNDLKVILENAYSCLLVLEDISLFIGDATSNKLIGSLCTNRHKDMDVITHFQFISKAGHPKFKPLCSMLRMHKTGDSCRRGGEKRFGGDYPKVRIGEIIVNKRFFLGVNKIEELDSRGISKDSKECQHWENNYRRFYLYVDFDKHKIKGAFTYDEYLEACKEYVQENYNTEVKPLLNVIDMNTGKKKYDAKSAISVKIDELLMYYGNSDKPKNIKIKNEPNNRLSNAA